MAEPSDLAGRWRLSRRIDNGVTVEGLAVLTPLSAGGLRYREDGTMRLPSGEALAAFADYLFTPELESLAIWFDEAPPRLFQHFRLSVGADGGLAGMSRHDCAPDLYLSEIVFAPDGWWSLRHAVTGPRKAYVSLTRYDRESL